MLDAINRVMKRHKGRIDKIAFAKALIEECNKPSAKMRPHVDVFLDRMRIIFRAVNEAVRRATDDAASKKLETLVAERVALFKVDNPSHATREQANIALRQIETQLDESAEAEAIRNAMVPLRRDFQLHESPAERVLDYQNFIEQLESLKHAWRAQLDKATRSENSEAKPTEKSNVPKPQAPKSSAKKTQVRPARSKPKNSQPTNAAAASENGNEN